MYDLLDRPVPTLAPIDAFVLRATRDWVHGLTLAGSPDAATAPGFAALGLGDEHEAFDDLMRALDRGSGDTLTIQRPCHATVEEEEAVLLGIWRLVLSDRIAEAAASARLLVDPATATALVRGMAGVLQGLRPALELR